MAKTGDSDVVPSTEDSSGEFEMQCRLCGTDLGQDWPNLSKLNPLDIKNHALYEWRGAADWGCPFCNIVVSVLDDSWKQYGCYDTLYRKDLEKGLDSGWQGFQVLLHPNAKGQYLLSLEHVKIPVLGDLASFVERDLGTITIYMDRKP